MAFQCRLTTPWLQTGHLQLRNLMLQLRISEPWRFYLGFQNDMPRFVPH